MEKWFKQAGYTRVVNRASKWSTQDRLNAEEASDKHNNDEYHVVILINHGIVSLNKYDPAHSVFTAPTHYVALRSGIQFQPSVKFDVYSWGGWAGYDYANQTAKPAMPIKTIPPLGKTLSEEDFLGNYFGYIAAKF